jgi:hypothetical protein
MVLVGLGMAARIARDARTYEIAIVIVIAVAAVAGLGKVAGLTRGRAWWNGTNGGARATTRPRPPKDSGWRPSAASRMDSLQAST